MAKPLQNEPALETLLKKATEMGRDAGFLSKALTDHLNDMSRVHHGDVSRGGPDVPQLDHDMRSRLTSMIAALHDFAIAKPCPPMGKLNEADGV
jgi:pantoate kinase